MNAVKLVIGSVIVLVGLAAIGAVFGEPGFKFDDATPAERQAWLDAEAETMVIDVRAGIFSTGVKQTQMDLQEVIVDQDAKLVDIVIVAKGSLRTYRPKDFRMQFLAKTCRAMRGRHSAKSITAHASKSFARMAILLSQRTSPTPPANSIAHL